MFYKGTSSIEDESTNFLNDCESDQTIVDNIPLEAKTYLTSTLLNFERSDNPMNDLITISKNCELLRMNNFNYNFDETLSNCKAVQCMLSYLPSDNYEFVRNNLIALYNLFLCSNLTKFYICSQIELFSHLIDSPDISNIAEILLNLLREIAKYDSRRAIFRLASEFNFVGKIVRIISDAHFDQSQKNIFSYFIYFIVCVFEKLSKDQLAVPVDGVPLFFIPHPVISTYIKSDDISILLPVLKCFRQILLSWKNDGISSRFRQILLPAEIFNRIIEILRGTFDDEGEILRETLEVINVFVFHFITPFDNYDFDDDDEKESEEEDEEECDENDVRQRAKRASQIVRGLLFQMGKSQICLPEMIKFFGRIANYRILSKAMVKDENLVNLYQIYRGAKYEMKNNLSKIFLNIFINFPKKAVENCKFLDIILTDAFENIPKNGMKNDIEKANLFFRAIYKLFVENRELQTVFDDSEIIELLCYYKENFNECYYICLDILSDFYTNEKDDPHSAFKDVYDDE